MSYFEPEEYPEFPPWLKTVAIHVDRMAHDGRVKRLFIDMIDEYLDKCSGDQGKQYPDWPPMRAMEICEKGASLGAIHDVVCQKPAAGMFVDWDSLPKKLEDYTPEDFSRAKRLVDFWALEQWVKDLKDDTHRDVVEDWLADVSKAIEEPVADARELQNTGNVETEELKESPRESTGWQDVKERLERLCDQGKRYTSQSDLAGKIGCAPATINKAIRKSPKLTAWMDQARKEKAAPRATSLDEQVTDNVRQGGEADPSEVLIDDDVNNVMARLIDEAQTKGKSDEVARLNALNPDERRDMAQTYLAHTQDDEPSPLDSDRPGRRPHRVIHHKRV